jgi:hypothetical protein
MVMKPSAGIVAERLAAKILVNPLATRYLEIKRGSAPLRHDGASRAALRLEAPLARERRDGDN